MKTIVTKGLALLVLAFISHGSALAVESLSAAELASHCAQIKANPEGVDGIFCIRYIQGFIDGAVVTDERVTMNVADEYDKEESFSERAIRIRLGQRLSSYGSYYAEFCLGEPVPLAEVVNKIVDHLEDEDVSGKRLARSFVYSALRKHYPCEPGN
jgi:hypothetical protein